MLYAITILSAMAVIIIVNTALGAATLGFSALAVTLLTVSVIAIDGIFAFVIRRLPERFFDYRLKLYRVPKKEQ